MKVYIAGKISGKEDYKKLFDEAEEELKSSGHAVLNPAVLPPVGFEHHEYMKICLSMVDVCDAVYFLNNWTESTGARMEYCHACENNKMLMFQEKGGVL